MRTYVVTVFAAAALAGSGVAWAGTNSFTVPTFRGTPGATFDGWESFKVAVGAPGNAGDLAGSSGDASLLQTAAGASVLGSGNIYNGAGPSLFEVRYSGAADVGDVVLQVRTLGTELKYDDVKLFAWTQSQGATRVELDRLSFGPPPPSPGSGVGVSSLWQWDLTSLKTTSFAISFGAAEANLSFDSATLDVRTVPEPTPVALLLLGAGALWVSRRTKSAAGR